MLVSAGTQGSDCSRTMVTGTSCPSATAGNVWPQGNLEIDPGVQMIAAFLPNQIPSGIWVGDAQAEKVQFKMEQDPPHSYPPPSPPAAASRRSSLKVRFSQTTHLGDSLQSKANSSGFRKFLWPQLKVCSLPLTLLFAASRESRPCHPLPVAGKSRAGGLELGTRSKSEPVFIRSRSLRSKASHTGY